MKVAAILVLCAGLVHAKGVGFSFGGGDGALPTFSIPSIPSLSIPSVSIPSFTFSAPTSLPTGGVGNFTALQICASCPTSGKCISCVNKCSVAAFCADKTCAKQSTSDIKSCDSTLNTCQKACSQLTSRKRHSCVAGCVGDHVSCLKTVAKSYGTCCQQSCSTDSCGCPASASSSGLASFGLPTDMPSIMPSMSSAPSSDDGPDASSMPIATACPSFSAPTTTVTITVSA